MNETELKDQLIKEFVNLQCIKAAQDKAAEIEYVASDFINTAQKTANSFYIHCLIFSKLFLKF